jgi:putative oxidoreductase
MSMSQLTVQPPPGIRSRHRAAAAFERMLATDRSWLVAAQRVTLGGVLLAHGLQKVFGWFHGPGYAGTMRFFTEHQHLPAALAVFVMFVGTVGSLGLIFGALTRLAALGAATVMFGALVTVHAANGFFMNWFGHQAGEGLEFDLLFFALALAPLVQGGGRWSVDGRLAHRALEAVAAVVEGLAHRDK